MAIDHIQTIISLFSCLSIKIEAHDHRLHYILFFHYQNSMYDFQNTINIIFMLHYHNPKLKSFFYSLRILYSSIMFTQNYLKNQTNLQKKKKIHSYSIPLFN